MSQLKGVTYSWKVKEFPGEKFDSRKHIGFIAQDVEKIFPEVVVTRADGYKTMDYDKLVPVLVEAIKELQDKSEQQSELIRELMQQIDLQSNKTTVRK